ncbi:MULTISPECIES: hypothetical protein [unclassified Arsenophonus]|uniref:hypothetical protein n=1 Tax=unclassified Arsenophonus TaxID=2627083 RepID=UPI00285AA3D6|nr:hypothetical protein [Arsenophonus sp.]MDR5610993.1 hypothetical protein [Arsenophonus sp.]MDR5614948.1 hypothetical protein [Arsenophonus sp.]
MDFNREIKTITVDDFNAFLRHKNIATMCSMCHQVGEQIIDETDFENFQEKPSANRFVTFFHHQPVIHGDNDINYYYKLTCHHCRYITTYSVSAVLRWLAEN